MAQVLHEGRWPGAYLVSDDIHLSREAVVFAQAPLEITAGQVMGKITATGKYVPLAPAAKDGSEKAAAISYDNVDVTQADKLAPATLRQAAVKASELIWPVGITDAQKTKAIADLEAVTIILR